MLLFKSTIFYWTYLSFNCFYKKCSVNGFIVESFPEAKLYVTPQHKNVSMVKAYLGRHTLSKYSLTTSGSLWAILLVSKKSENHCPGFICNKCIPVHEWPTVLFNSDRNKNINTWVLTASSPLVSQRKLCSCPNDPIHSPYPQHPSKKDCFVQPGNKGLLKVDRCMQPKRHINSYTGKGENYQLENRPRKGKVGGGEEDKAGSKKEILNKEVMEQIGSSCRGWERCWS